MAVFLDTGILLRAVERRDPCYSVVRSSIRTLLGQSSELVIGLQQVAEFWNVCTRPPGQRGGFNLPSTEVARRLRKIEAGVKILTETYSTPTIWRSLAEKYAVRGVQVHDLRVVALMLSHGVSELLTLNPSDFARFEREGLTIRTPQRVVEQAAPPRG